MNPEHKEALVKHYTYLQENIRIDGQFLGYLIQYKIISDEAREKIKALSESVAKVSEVISLLKKCQDGTLVKFLDALRKTEQDHIADRLYVSCYPVAGAEWELEVKGRLKTFIHKHYQESKKWSTKDADVAEKGLVLLSDYNIQVAARDEAKREYKQLKALLQEKDSTIDQLKDRLRLTEEKSISDQQRQLDNFKTKLASKRSTIEKLEHEITELENKDFRFTADSRELIKMRAANTELQKELNAREKEFEEYKSKYPIIDESLSGAFEDMEKTITDKERELTKKRKELSDNEKEMAEVKVTLGLQPSAPNDEVISKIKSLKQNGKEMSKQHEDLLSAQSALKKTIASLEKQVGYGKHTRDEIKKNIGLNPNASHTDVLSKLRELMRHTKATKEEIAEVQKYVNNYHATIINLNYAATTTRKTSATSMNRYTPLPNIGRANKFCLICRTFINTQRNADICTVHHLGAHNGKWLCCNKVLVDTGCMRMHHCYIEHQHMRTILTNGRGSIDVTIND